MNIEQIDNFFKYRNKKFGKKIKTEQELKSKKETLFYFFKEYLNEILKYYTFNLGVYITSIIDDNNRSSLSNLLFTYNECLNNLDLFFQKIKDYNTVDIPKGDEWDNSHYQEILNNFYLNKNSLNILTDTYFVGIKSSHNFVTNEIDNLQELIFENFKNLFIVFEELCSFNEYLSDNIHSIIKSNYTIEEKNNLLLNIQSQFIIYFKNLNYSQNPDFIMLKFISGIFWNFYKKILATFNEHNEIENLILNNEWREIQGLLAVDHQSLLNNFNIFNNNISEKILELFKEWKNIINNYIKFRELDYDEICPYFLTGKELIPLEQEKLFLWKCANKKDMRTTLINTVNFLSTYSSIRIDINELINVSSKPQLEKWNWKNLQSCLASVKIRNNLKIYCPDEFNMLRDLKEIFGYHPNNTGVERFEKIIIYKFLETKILEQISEQHPELKNLNKLKKILIKKVEQKNKMKSIDTTINLNQNLPGSSSR